jgi:hypothetical protein
VDFNFVDAAYGDRAADGPRDAGAGDGIIAVLVGMETVQPVAAADGGCSGETVEFE